MAAPPGQLLQCSVRLLRLNEEQLREGLQIAQPAQKALRLELCARDGGAEVAVTDG